MTVRHRVTAAQPDARSRYDDHVVHDDGVHLRARCRHRATVLLVSGRLDTTNVDRVSADATRLALVGNALLLDLSGVNSFSAQAVSLLSAVDDACCAAAVPWVLVSSPAVDQALRVADCDGVPTVNSVPAAMQHFAQLAQARRELRWGLHGEAGAV